MADVKFEIIEKITVLSTNAKGWSLELNKISWNEREPKFDLRSWDEKHQKMGKGLTFNCEEAKELFSGLGKYLEK